MAVFLVNMGAALTLLPIACDIASDEENDHPLSAVADKFQYLGPLITWIALLCFSSAYYSLKDADSILFFSFLAALLTGGFSGNLLRSLHGSFSWEIPIDELGNSISFKPHQNQITQETIVLINLVFTAFLALCGATWIVPSLCVQTAALIYQFMYPSTACFSQSMDVSRSGRCSSFSGSGFSWNVKKVDAHLYFPKYNRKIEDKSKAPVQFCNHSNHYLSNEELSSYLQEQASKVAKIAESQLEVSGNYRFQNGSYSGSSFYLDARIKPVTIPSICPDSPPYKLQDLHPEITCTAHITNQSVRGFAEQRDLADCEVALSTSIAFDKEEKQEIDQVS